ncbi:hypothetical protein RHGRI_006531 [Rhododendron griersonianum]|uniref:AAA+ ATPase domain-containing protein n=1 Tax=Rhododendron griersonianum TaxID=479676 RepID=A0AAV6KTF4_9ERIC|nr:hypothetical protein RHGRI_006531 [Rhododendron griersonianum]
MAAALALNCLGNTAKGILGNVGEYFFAPIQRKFKYMCCFNSNITELETQLKKLETTKEGVQLRVDEDLRNVRIIAPEVENWLKIVDEVTPEVKGIIQDKAKVKEGCLYGWGPNLKLRYSLSRKAVKKTKVVVDLQADEVAYTKPPYSPNPSCMGTIPNGDFTGFESRRVVMEEIIKALKNDEINLIGVCGMPGVGKTTLVKEVANRAKEDNHFDEVAMAVVRQKQDVTHVQVCIADTLGLKNLRDTESPIERANLLRKRLLQNNKKILVILDDIWADKFDLQGERIDLQGMGIPLGGANKNFKMLYTSRTRDLWHDLRTKKEIPLDLLSEEEAWRLFREKAGDSTESPNLKSIAKKIVNECGRLPLALVLIASALSKRSGSDHTQEIWKAMLDRLTCAGSTLQVDKDLYSRLQLSYEYLEDEQTKRLFLLCCLFREDEDIRIEDLARYGLGLSLFHGIHEMEIVRRQVFHIVGDLKSRYLLLDSEEEKEECVKVHDVVRDMGISIASKDKSALVIHEEVFEWRKDTYEHYSSISLISRKITKLPKGLACPNLVFLLLDCRELKELPRQFFEGMGKLKVLVLKNFKGILALPSSLRNLHTLSLPFFNGKLDNVSEFGGLFNLNTLSFRDSRMEELPEEIGELVNLRLLDLTGYYGLLKRIPPNVISRLVNLEELYVGGVVDLRKGRMVDFRKLYGRGKFKDWEGEGKEEEGRNANLRELELLSNLNTLEIFIRSDVLIPKVRIFSKLKIYKVIIVQDEIKRKWYMCKAISISEEDVWDKEHEDVWDKEHEDEIYNLFGKCKRVFMVGSSIPVPSDRGGIDSLLRRSDCLCLKGKGCNDLVQALLLRVRDGVDRLQQLKLLRIERCDTPECLANTRNPVHLPIAHVPAIFPILEVLYLLGLVNLREICGGPVPARSFGELTFIQVQNCGRLRNLFQLPIVGCLPQLKRLIISSCGMMEEVIWKDQQEDVHVATNRIEFPKLEVLKLVKLPSLVGFCRAIDQIDFPQLKELWLEDIPQVNLLFHNSCNLSSNSKRNDNFGFLSLFPEKVCAYFFSFPFTSFVLRLRNLFQLTIVGCLPQLKRLIISSCGMMEEVFWKDQQEDVRAAANRIEFPKLEVLKLQNLPSLMRFCKGIDQIDFPQLKELCLKDMPQVNLLFYNSCNLSSNSKRNDNFGFLSLFPEKVSLPNLEVLDVYQLENLERLEHCPLSARSFGELTFIQVQYCGRLRNLFQLPIVGCLSQLKRLIISSCGMMEEVFWKDQQEDVRAATNRIEFPKLEVLKLVKLPSLVGFCRGIDQIDFPQLKELYLVDIPQVNFLFHNNGNLSSNSKRNDNFGFLSLFPGKRQ